MDKQGFLAGIQGEFRNYVEQMPYYSADPTVDKKPMTWYTALLRGSECDTAKLYWVESSTTYIEIVLKNLFYRNPPTQTADIEFVRVTLPNKTTVQLTTVPDSKAQEALAALSYVSEVLTSTYMHADDVTGVVGSAVILSGYLVNADFPTQHIPNKGVLLSFNGYSIWTGTDVDGNFSYAWPLSYVPVVAGSYDYTVTYAGDIDYYGSSAAGVVTLSEQGGGLKEVGLSCWNWTAMVGGEVRLQARLRSDGVGVPSRVLEFIFNGHKYAGTTNSNGEVVIIVPVGCCPATAGTYSYSVSFVGDYLYYGAATSCVVTLTAIPQVRVVKVYTTPDNVSVKVDGVYGGLT